MSPFNHIQAVGKTDVGLLRKNNEDNLLLLDSAGVWLVADGMGGGMEGEFASQAVVESVAELFREDPGLEAPPATMKRKMELLRRGCNRACRVIQRRKLELDADQMGSTVVAICLDAAAPKHACVLHAGDSRAYRFHLGQLSQISRDHSVGNELGHDSAEDLPAMYQGVLTRAVGIRSKVDLEVTHFDLSDGDILLLCSDGLANMVSNDRLAAIIQESLAEEPSILAARLIQAALAAGGKDNITVVVAKAGSLPPPMAIESLSGENDAGDTSPGGPGAEDEGEPVTMGGTSADTLLRLDNADVDSSQLATSPGGGSGMGSAIDRLRLVYWDELRPRWLRLRRRRSFWLGLSGLCLLLCGLVLFGLRKPELITVSVPTHALDGAHWAVSVLENNSYRPVADGSFAAAPGKYQFKFQRDDYRDQADFEFQLREPAQSVRPPSAWLPAEPLSTLRRAKELLANAAKTNRVEQAKLEAKSLTPELFADPVHRAELARFQDEVRSLSLAPALLLPTPDPKQASASDSLGEIKLASAADWPKNQSLPLLFLLGADGNGVTQRWERAGLRLPLPSGKYQSRLECENRETVPGSLLVPPSGEVVLHLPDLAAWPKKAWFRRLEEAEDQRAAGRVEGAALILKEYLKDLQGSPPWPAAYQRRWIDLSAWISAEAVGIADRLQLALESGEASEAIDSFVRSSPLLDLAGGLEPDHVLTQRVADLRKSLEATLAAQLANLLLRAETNGSWGEVSNLISRVTRESGLPDRLVQLSSQEGEWVRIWCQLISGGGESLAKTADEGLGRWESLLGLRRTPPPAWSKEASAADGWCRSLRQRRNDVIQSLEDMSTLAGLMASLNEKPETKHLEIFDLFLLKINALPSAPENPQHSSPPLPRDELAASPPLQEKRLCWDRTASLDLKQKLAAVAAEFRVEVSPGRVWISVPPAEMQRGILDLAAFWQKRHGELMLLSLREVLVAQVASYIQFSGKVDPSKLIAAAASYRNKTASIPENPLLLAEWYRAGGWPGFLGVLRCFNPDTVAPPLE